MLLLFSLHAQQFSCSCLRSTMCLLIFYRFVFSRLSGPSRMRLGLVLRRAWRILMFSLQVSSPHDWRSFESTQRYPRPHGLNACCAELRSCTVRPASSILRLDLKCMGEAQWPQTDKEDNMVKQGFSRIRRRRRRLIVGYHDGGAFSFMDCQLLRSIYAGLSYLIRFNTSAGIARTIRSDTERGVHALTRQR